MITEDYVSKETYKLLKEKGYNGEFKTCYDMEGYTCPVIHLYDAMKWLRGKHKLFVDVAPNVEYYIKKNEVKYRKPYYTFVISSLTSGEPITYSRLTEKYKSYEEVCEAAIKYVLENLI